MAVKIDKDLEILLEKLAAEDGISPVTFVEKLIKEEDEERHVTWVPKSKLFQRSRCNRKNCFEAAPQLPRGYGY